MGKRIEYQLCVKWSVDDVLSVRKDLNRSKAVEVLKRAERGHDANIGINWEVLEYWADYLYPVKGAN